MPKKNRDKKAKLIVSQTGRLRISFVQKIKKKNMCTTFALALQSLRFFFFFWLSHDPGRFFPTIC